MEKCKLVIREAVKSCEEAGGLPAIPPAAYESDGGLDEAHIFCALCSGVDSFEVRCGVRWQPGLCSGFCPLGGNTFLCRAALGLTAVTRTCELPP